MLDRLAQPQFWVAALTIATRQHAQLLRLSTNTVELEAGADSLAVLDHEPEEPRLPRDRGQHGQRGLQHELHKFVGQQGEDGDG